MKSTVSTLLIVFAAIVPLPGFANPIPVPPPAQMPLEDMVITIQPLGNGLHADFTGDFTFTYIPGDVVAMRFPFPPGTTNIQVWQDGTPKSWAWIADQYPTILPEMPLIPMIEWPGPFPTEGAVFTVAYEHDLIERPDEFIYFYAVGTGKYFPTYDKTTTAYFDILLPSEYVVRGVWLDDTPHAYDVVDGHLLITVESQFGPIVNDLIVSLVPAPTGDFDKDGDVDADDYRCFFICHTGPCPSPPCRPSLFGDLSCAIGDFDVDGDLDLMDFSAFQSVFGEATGPGEPRIGGYSNSGCLSESRSGYPWCGEDEIEVAVEGTTLHVWHRNATYNCCPDDIVVSLSAQGSMLCLTEDEVLTIPCDCMCCYDVEATVVNLAPGPYTVQFCWVDHDIGGEQCWVEHVVIP
jgi:hypothetical protein